jgi:hypothetical protein
MKKRLAKFSLGLMRLNVGMASFKETFGLSSRQALRAVFRPPKRMTVKHHATLAHPRSIPSCHRRGPPPSLPR